jgi:nucleotide-binding universal stress UspA family protein
MIRKIVVPLDGSEVSEKILPHVSELFRAADADIRFVHVYDWSEGGFTRGRDYLKGLARRLGDRFPSAQTELLKGAPAFEIMKYAVVQHADLIAMTTRGHSGVRKLLFGSTALELMSRSQVPLFLARPSCPSRPIRKILVPLDGSKTSLGILPVVADLARGTDAKVELLTLLPHDGVAEPASRELRRVSDLFNKRGIPVESLVKPGEAAAGILESAREVAADLIALGTHGRTGSDRFFFGSVAESVIQGAEVPLMLRRKPRTILKRRAAPRRRAARVPVS